ncbi:type II toxin-antitoxin system VapC family toxin [Blastomonas sp.]|uniref:type II toxin-antitoxin system VapC family toxin n=1 Tax=Blastomonas sp. TaxID=1909299 RepID=UPI0026364CB8|nr:type II toxin-antitoxin system VapC family toxin [Blastomonas sp.]MDM7957384.1 type II toxin-antitoxin system VapC family toxin [Blastomonas sp.]
MSAFLFDTHALIWWWNDNLLLPKAVRRGLIDPDNAIFVSAASAWEVATKVRLGKWQEAEEAAEQFEALCERNGFELLPVSVTHGLLAGSLPGEHRDPFDRMIAAQAIQDDLVVITRDPALASLGCATFWAD